MTRPILGCIADDLTGATDLANNLMRAGMRTTLVIGVPDAAAALEADAIVVALKSRTIAASKAVEQSLCACHWLRAQGALQIYFKICSTFDSTSKGNIGPVIEALMDELGCAFSVVAPAFPLNQRIVSRGELFVGGQLLSESAMRHHPLTPMTDANLVRFLQTQLHTRKQRRTGLIDEHVVSASAEAIRARIEKLRADGVSIAIADTLDEADLARLAVALKDALLVTASSGLALELPAAWGFSAPTEPARLPAPSGHKAILSGSCSAATNAQLVNFAESGGSVFQLNVPRLAEDPRAEVASALQWAAKAWRAQPQEPVLISTTAEPDPLYAIQATLGVERSSELVEKALAPITYALVRQGAGQLIVAGGETAGAGMKALGIQQAEVGPQIDPGVPWCTAECALATNRRLHLALKSGNFGAADFFRKAFTLLH